MVRLAGGEDVVSGLFARAGKVQVGGVGWRVSGVRNALVGLIKLYDQSANVYSPVLHVNLQ